VQPPEVFDYQVIMQAIKALRAGSFTTISQKIIQGQFKSCMKILKNSKSELLHFRKLEQQRKSTTENEASRLTRYNRGRVSTNNCDSTPKHVNDIDFDSCGP
jgi:hypothetical protein